MALEETQSRVLRNVAYNVLAYAIPAVVALIAIKFAVNGLGRARFGVLALTWSVLSYFTFFDLGVGRAMTQRLPALLEAGDARGVRAVVGTAVCVLAGLGLLAGGLLAVVAPWLVNHAVTIPAAMRGESIAAFDVLAITVPVLIVAAGFRSALEGAERFGLANFVRVPQSLSIFVVAAVAPHLGWNLVAISWASLIAVAVACVSYLGLLLAVVPAARHARFDRRQLPDLARFGGWLTAAHLVWSLMLQLDRFAIGVVLGATFIAYYAAPYEVVSRALVLASALIAFMPAVARLGAGRPNDIARLAAWSVRNVLLVAGLPLLFVAVFSHVLLNFWLGADFARYSAGALSILSMALLLSLMASVPDLVLKGLGQPRPVALIHITLLGPYAVLLYVFISRFGITGAALAWAMRALVETILLFWASARLLGRVPTILYDPGLRHLVLFLAGYGAVLMIGSMLFPAWVALLYGGAVVLISVLAAWWVLLSASERLQLKRLVMLA